MANDVSNNQGLTTGSQQVGKVTLGKGKHPFSYESNNFEYNPVTDISDKYDERFDDYNYYE
jgi:hypothetical protein